MKLLFFNLGDLINVGGSQISSVFSDMNLGDNCI